MHCAVLRLIGLAATERRDGAGADSGHGQSGHGVPCPYGFVDASCAATFIRAAVEMAVRIFTIGSEGTPLVFFVSAYSKRLKVLCFDTVSQVFIPSGLR